MAEQPVIVMGGGGHAKVVVALLKKLPRFRLLGFTEIMSREDILDVRCLGDDSILEEVIARNPECAAVYGIGFFSDDEIDRKSRHVKDLQKLGYTLPAVSASTALLGEDVVLGSGTVVCEKAVIQVGSRIGDHGIVNTGCLVEHDCHIGDFAHLASGVIVGGGVRMGNRCRIGSGAVLRNGITLVSGCVIGVGAVVVRDCKEEGIYTGIPAERKIR